MMYTKQKLIVQLFLLTFITTVISSKVDFEKLNIEGLLSNEERTKSAFACLMDKKPCGEWQGLRDTIPELIKTKCGACTPKEKKKYDHVSKVLLEKNPEIFNALVLKYSANENPYQ
ncbi:allergen Tha p 1-like [Maniola jurtina]|uniref:allergen Tha p 1-like n=1 Tax=Maniola jurtina TaxID=191418 RepID=UPI001E687BD8|nr:allergen Tha p 1-like [Maniola jurtina]